MVLYIKEQNTLLQKRDTSLVVTKQAATLYRIPVTGLTRLIVIGNVQITTQALHLLLTSGIDVAYFYCGLRLIGTVQSATSGNVFLRMAQYSRYTNLELNLAVAHALSAAKMRGQIACIRSHRWAPEETSHTRTIEQIQSLLESLPQRSNMDALRGAEGAASRAYFEAYGRMFKDCTFSGRSRRPANNPPNALLNLSYTLLTMEMAAILEGSGLDPCLGLMHGLVYGRQSQALDMIEPFRPAVDRLVLRLLNLHILRDEHFEQDSRMGFRLNQEGIDLFFQQYEKHMGAENEAQTLRAGMQAQVTSYRRWLMEGAGFVPWQTQESESSSATT